METRAPIKNATAVQSPNSVKNQTMKNIITMKIKHIRYSALKNSFAPYIAQYLLMRFYVRFLGGDFIDVDL